MRITNAMMVNNLKYNLGQNMGRLDKLQNQLATGHRISRASDDPTGIVNTLRYKSTIIESEKYLQNISDARNFLNSTDSALGNATQIIHRADELIVQGLNDSNSPEAREAIAAEMRQLREQIGVIANTTFGGKHIFSGTNITQGPLQTGPPAT
ncbi:MAG: flagellar hook-associated protein FlgL, partial [Syntrophomonadaceae bacterium]|nr:flagellar hook-associated protein FlgL [Syntrophomonadaceae bacterium]